MFVFEMNDCDWVVARSAEEAADWYMDIAAPLDYAGMRALTAEELDEFDYFLERRGGPAISFRQRLQQIVADGSFIPNLFASTNF
ncbi:hypothetical protein JW897_04200 [Chromobacterium alkanivorans]|uniref:hypothetical protein n=1 Tax=Chromobacterium alkanivorans TaxID=1071719 RepID=UPI0019681AFE|nr:hypothetical protein [Chromobacterium alkanivorans]MBN3002931.1 hypothetical protein [Chromobacterium alkanivorans]